MFVALGKILHMNVTIRPQNTLPKITVAQVHQKFRPIKTAKQVPVQTPVSGTGKETKSTTVNILNTNCTVLDLSFDFAETSADFFSAPPTKKDANPLKNFLSFNLTYIGLKIKAKIGTTKELPNKANPKACIGERANSPQKVLLKAKGIAPFNSIIGKIEINIVASIILSLKIV